MKSEKAEKRFLMSMIGVLLLLSIFPYVSQAAIPQKISYQGYLTTAAGVPINGAIQMVFSIYNAAVGGAPLWTETHTVNVVNGVYDVILGEGSPSVPINLTFDVPYYLGVTVGTDPEMAPRKIFTAVGYAFRALTADTVVGSGSFTTPIVSTVSAGTAPLQVNSTTNVANLSADLLDGQHGSAFAQAAHMHPMGDLTGTLPIGSGGTNATTASGARTNLGVPWLSGENTFVTGTQTVRTGKPGTIGMVVRGENTQSANLQEWQNSGGTAVASVDPAGRFTGDGSGLSGVEKRTAISACVTISTSGSYYLTQNLSTSGTCIRVTVNDVTIDLNGFTLTGDGSGYGVFIEDVSNAEVRNGTIRSFSQGIRGQNSIGGTTSNRVLNVRAIGNGVGILLGSSNSLIKDCTVADSTSGDGISARSGSIVMNNTVFNNQGNGIVASNGSIITNNTAYYNQSSGILLSIASTVTNNTVYSNNQSNSTGSGGIYITHGCIVKNNTVRNNLQNNVYVSGIDNAIEENLLTSSGNGIYFNAAGNFYANNRASGNTTNFNTGGFAQTDGGGNVGF